MESIEIAPGVILTTKFLASEDSAGTLARIGGTHQRYEFARTFLSRSGPPWGWPISAVGLYEWRVRSDDRDSAQFFVIEGAWRRQAKLVTREVASTLAARMGQKG